MPKETSTDTDSLQRIAAEVAAISTFVFGHQGQGGLNRQICMLEEEVILSKKVSIDGFEKIKAHLDSLNEFRWKSIGMAMGGGAVAAFVMRWIGV